MWQREAESSSRRSLNEGQRAEMAGIGAGGVMRDFQGRESPVDRGGGVRSKEVIKAFMKSFDFYYDCGKMKS